MTSGVYKRAKRTNKFRRSVEELREFTKENNIKLLKLWEYLKQWRVKNKKHILEYKKKWREKNKEHVLEYGKKWREKNKNKIEKYNKKWSKTEKGKASLKRSMKKYQEWYREKNQKKIKAQKLSNKIYTIRQICSVNGCNKLGVKHHSDYDKPLEIIWLCQRHHKELHKNNL